MSSSVNYFSNDCSDHCCSSNDRNDRNDKNSEHHKDSKCSVNYECYNPQICPPGKRGMVGPTGPMGISGKDAVSLIGPTGEKGKITPFYGYYSYGESPLTYDTNSVKLSINNVHNNFDVTYKSSNHTFKFNRDAQYNITINVCGFMTDIENKNEICLVKMVMSGDLPLTSGYVSEYIMPYITDINNVHTTSLGGYNMTHNVSIHAKKGNYFSIFLNFYRTDEITFEDVYQRSRGKLLNLNVTIFVCN